MDPCEPWVEWRVPSDMKVGILICFTTALVVCSCTEQSPEEYDEVAKRSGKYFDEDKKKDMSNFTFPDSTLNKPIIASYYEQDAGAHTIMYYTDTTRQFAKVIRYFPDRTVLTDKLGSTKFNEFRSLINNAEYVINNEYVNYIFEEHGLAHSFEHLRTDGNR